MNNWVNTVSYSRNKLQYVCSLIQNTEYKSTGRQTFPGSRYALYIYIYLPGCTPYVHTYIFLLRTTLYSVYYPAQSMHAFDACRHRTNHLDWSINLHSISSLPEKYSVDHSIVITPPYSVYRVIYHSYQISSSPPPSRASPASIVDRCIRSTVQGTECRVQRIDSAHHSWALTYFQTAWHFLQLRNVNPNYARTVLCICITIIFCLYSGNVPITRLTCPIRYTQLGVVQGQLFFFFFFHSDPAASGRCTPIVRFVKLDPDLYYIYIYLSILSKQSIQSIPFCFLPSFHLLTLLNSIYNIPIGTRIRLLPQLAVSPDWPTSIPDSGRGAGFKCVRGQSAAARGWGLARHPPVLLVCQRPIWRLIFCRIETEVTRSVMICYDHSV